MSYTIRYDGDDHDSLRAYLKHMQNNFDGTARKWVAEVNRWKDGVEINAEYQIIGLTAFDNDEYLAVRTYTESPPEGVSQIGEEVHLIPFGEVTGLHYF